MLFHLRWYQTRVRITDAVDAAAATRAAQTLIPPICWGINFGCKQKMTVRSIADFARRAHSLVPCGEQEATGSLMFGTNCQVLCVSYGVLSDR